MALPQLPQDIIDVIIQTIGETSPFDAKQLGDLSLVSRAFVEQSQRYLFRTISLRRLDYKPSSFRLSDNADIKGSAFQDLFRTSPHVFRYIRTLKLVWSNRLLQIPWAITGPEAAAIINACTRLQVLELVSPSIGEVIDWHTIDPALRSALISQIHSTLLDKLTLSRVKHIPQFLLATFGLFTRLQLEYSSSSHFHSSQPDDAATTVPSKLTTLSIKESTPLLRFFLAHHPSMFSQILEVDVDFGRFNGEEDSSLMGDLLRKVCKIKEFHAILLTNANIDLINFDVHPLRYLCHISLLTSPGYLHGTYIFLKRVISAAPILENATVIVPMDGFRAMERLSAIRIWDDFHPSLGFQKLTLSFLLPQDGDSEYYNYYNAFEDFHPALLSALQGHAQLFSLIAERKIIIVYDITTSTLIWNHSVKLRRRALTHPSEFYSHFWVPPQ